MPADSLSVLVYVSALLLVWVPYGLHRKRRDAKSRALLEDSVRARSRTC
jgi:hypothetical protein